MNKYAMLSVAMGAAGVFVKVNVDSYNYVKSIALDGIPVGLNIAETTQTSNEQKTKYLNIAPPIIMERFGYKLGRKVYRI